MPRFFDPHYLVAITSNLIVAIEIEPHQHAARAEVIIPYHEQGDIFAIVCKLVGFEVYHAVGYERLRLGQFAQALAGRAEPAKHYSGVLSLCKRVDGQDVQGLLGYGMPFDGYGEGSTWRPRKLRYIVRSADYTWNSVPLRYGTCYDVEAWVDAPMSDEAMLSAFIDSFPIVGLPAMLQPEPVIATVERFAATPV